MATFNTIISDTAIPSTNYLQKLSDSLIASNSLVYDNGTNVLINATTEDGSGAKLQVNGNVNATGYKIPSGQSTQFLKANGSADATDYVSTTAAQTITGVKTFSPTVTVSGNIARGTILTPSLTAIANNDSLVALDINPTFNAGGLSNISNRVIQFSGSGQNVINSVGDFIIQRGGSSVFQGLSTNTLVRSISASQFLNFGLGTTEVGRFAATTGNFLINTTTDSGSKLQVNGNISATNLTSTGQTTYIGTPLWSFTTSAPSGSTNFTYSWTQSGKCVTLRINLSYTTAGVACTAVSIPLPAGAPTPEVPSGFTGNSVGLYYGYGMLGTVLTVAGVVNNAVTALRTNATSTGFDIFIQRASGNYQYAYATVQYFVA